MERSGKKICSHWQEGIFDSSPSMDHGCLLDSACLGQQCSIKVSFLSSSNNKIPKAFNNQRLSGKYIVLETPSLFYCQLTYVLLLPSWALFSPGFDALPLFVPPCLFFPGYSPSNTSFYCLSSLLLEDTCSPACLCNQEVCLTSKVTVRCWGRVGIGYLGFPPPPPPLFFAQGLGKCDPCLGQNSILLLRTSV